jgi:hypothetical protein
MGEGVRDECAATSGVEATEAFSMERSNTGEKKGLGWSQGGIVGSRGELVSSLFFFFFLFEAIVCGLRRAGDLWCYASPLQSGAAGLGRKRCGGGGGFLPVAVRMRLLLLLLGLGGRVVGGGCCHGYRCCWSPSMRMCMLAPVLLFLLLLRTGGDLLSMTCCSTSFGNCSSPLQLPSTQLQWILDSRLIVEMWRSRAARQFA